MRKQLLYGLAGAVLLASLVGAGAVAFFGRTSRSVTAEVVAFTRSAPYTITFQVDKPPADTVRCDVAEVDFDGNPVGEVDGIVVGPAPQRSVQLRVTVPVRGTPTQPQVLQCVHVGSR